MMSSTYPIRSNDMLDSHTAWGSQWVGAQTFNSCEWM